MQRLFKRFTVLAAVSLNVSPLFAEEQWSTVYLAGGCFWCIESDYEQKEGVQEVVSGYMGTGLNPPTYQSVSAGQGRYREVVKVVFDAKKISKKQIYTDFFKSHDPFDTQGQFCDKGFHYSPAMYFSDESEQILAKQVLEEMRSVLGQVKTPIEPVSIFTAAEDYHQDYYKNNPIRYKAYRYNCGRDARMNKVWEAKK